MNIKEMWNKKDFSNIQFTKEKKEKIIIIFLLGIFFLIAATPVSSFSKKKESKNETTEEMETVTEKNIENNAYIKELENKLEQTIGGMEGAGKVIVMITLKDNGEKILDKNQPYESETITNKDNETTSSSIKSDQETVLVEKEGDTSPIIIQENSPGIEGVVVVCEGGDNTILALHIKEAVEALFSIDAHKVVVCKLQAE